jgi:hypothetical protein
MPRAKPRESSAPIMPPLCEAAKMRPAGSGCSSKAALAVSITWAHRFTTPRLDGPTMRRPVRAVTSRSCATRAKPSGPASPKPSASTVATFTPSRPHSRTASTAASVPVTI